MSINEFEKEIKGRLTDYESVIDAEALWSDLQPLEEKNNRKIFLWLFFGLLSLLMIVGGYLFINNSQINTVSQSENNTTKTKEINKQFITEDKIEEKSIQKSNALNKENDTPQKLNNAVKKDKKKKDSIQSKKEQKQNKSSKQASSINNVSNNNAKNGIEYKQSGTIITKPIATNSSTRNNNDVVSNPNKDNAKRTSATTIKKLLPNTLIAKEVNLILIPEINHSIALLDYKRKKEKLRLGDPILSKINPITKRWELVMSFMPEYAFRNLSLLDNNQFRQIHLNRRLSSEFYEFSYKTGLELRHQTKKGLRFSAGVNYGQLTEVLNNVTDLGVTTVTDTTYIDKIIKLTETEFDTTYGGSQTLQSYHIRKIYNKYRTVNIPISIGSIKQKNGWTYGFDLGASFNLMFKQKGQILNVEGDETRILEGDELFFNDKIGITLFGSLAVGYNIGRNINVELAPRFSYGLDSWTHQESGFNTKYNHLGLKCSISYKL